MVVSRLARFSFFVCFMLALSRPSDAALLDLIWGLSGPQLVGLGVVCHWDVDLKKEICEFSLPPSARTQSDRRPRALFSVASTAFVSTGKNSQSHFDFKFGDVAMLAFEPNISFGSKQFSSGRQLSHGVGVTYDVLLGRNFRGFDKFGIKVIPLEVLLPKQRVDIALTVRLYPNGFSDDEFGIGLRRDYDRPFEAVYGVTFTVLGKAR